MIVQLYRAYSDWVTDGMRRLRRRLMARRMRKGLLTEPMAALEWEMFETLKGIVPIHFLLVTGIVMIFVGFASGAVPYNANILNGVFVAALPLQLWQLRITLKYAKALKPLRRAATLRGDIKAHFPDRLWYRRQRRRGLA